MTLEVGDAWVRIEDLVQVADGGMPVALAPAARQRVASARELVMRLATSGQAIYGLNSALGAKDGLALISANSATTARSALVLHEASMVLDAWLAAVALGYEGFRANLSPLDEAAVAARPATGQVETAGRLRALLKGSSLLSPGAARRVQDPVSMRGVSQVHGAAQGMVDTARAQVEVELNSAGDSPLVLTDAGAMLSNGNFHVPALALALDAAANGMAQAASMSVARCQRFMAPALTGLPLQLTRHGPAHSGFATVQKTLTALWAEIRLRANPGSLDYFPVSEALEDHACMALGVAEKLGELLERVRYLVAIELLVGAQAVDLRELDTTTMGAGARECYRQVRALVPMLDEDRPIGPDIDRVKAAVAAGQFSFLGKGSA